MKLLELELRSPRGRDPPQPGPPRAPGTFLLIPHFVSTHLSSCCAPSSTAGGCKELRCALRVLGSEYGRRGAHLAGITAPPHPTPPGDGEDDFSPLGSSGPEGEQAHAKRKLIGHTCLACLCLLVPVFFFLLPPLPPAEGRDFPLSLIFTAEQRGVENRPGPLVTPGDDYFSK